MYGILAPMDFNAFREEHSDEYFYFLAPNQLLAKNAAQKMQALRAYFQFALSKEQLQRLSAKVVFEDEMPTDIEHIPEPMQPLPPAKILRDGQLIIRHNGMEFTPQGQRVR
jgi:site-specific recombinase XerD